MLDIARQDVRFALRQIGRGPGFSAIVVLALALGLGATAAMFAVVHSTVIEPLDYPQADRLVYIDQPVPKSDADHPWPVSAAAYWDYRAHVPALAAIGAYSTTKFGVIRHTGGTRRVSGVEATASLLDVLGAKAVLGRLFSAEDDRPGAPPVAVLSYAYWQQAFGGDHNIVGSKLRIDGHPVAVIGVMAKGFRLPRQAADVWIPARLDPAASPIKYFYLSVVGRLAPGVSLAQVQSQLEQRVAGFSERFPSVYTPQFMRKFAFGVEAAPLRDYVLGDVARGLWILLASVALVLLIACANVANLFLLRVETRRRELAVRMALGVSRRRLAGHYVAEAVMLSLIAGALAVAVAYAGVAFLLHLPPPWLPRLSDIHMGTADAVSALGLSLVAGVFFGVLPVLRRAVNLAELRDGGRGLSATRADKRARASLVAGQVAIGFFLVVVGALLARSFVRLQSVQSGFKASSVLTMQVSLPRQQYADYSATSTFWRQLVEAIRTLRGVDSVGAGDGVPILGTDYCAQLWIEGRPTVKSGATGCIPIAAVTPGYFQALGIQVRGRLPTWSDVQQGTGAVVITRTLAEHLWPDQNPIGKGLRGRGPGKLYYRVVGVSGDLRMKGLDRPPTPVAFFPIKPPSRSLPLWGPYRQMTLVVRANGLAPSALANAIRKKVAAIGPDAAVGRVSTMSAIISQSLARRTFTLLLLGFAGSLALLLAAIGIYGVVAHVVECRRSEIGVRIALGASVGRIGRLIVTDSLRTATWGIAIGLGVSLLAGRLLRSLLFEVTPTDPLAFAAAALVLLAVTVVATLIPAVRAARVDPTEALKAE